MNKDEAERLLREFVRGGKYVELDRIRELLKKYTAENGPKIRAKVSPHGRWTGGRYHERFHNSYEEQCTNCRCWSLEYDKPYYPNCGAIMDKEEAQYE